MPSFAAVSGPRIQSRGVAEDVGKISEKEVTRAKRSGKRRRRRSLGKAVALLLLSVILSRNGGNFSSSSSSLWSFSK